jgi:phospholipase/carboxylesterase
VIEPTPILIGDWVTMQRKPATGRASRVLILLHGLSGDEKVMWLFARNISADYVIIAPRGIFHAAEGGYSWVYSEASSGLNSIGDFKTAVESLSSLLDDWLPQVATPDAQIHWMGFSQGAALCIAYALAQPKQTASLAILSGYIPGEIPMQRFSSLRGKRIFIAHGSHDERILVSAARSANSILASVGAEVIYCESETGHKLGASCFRALSDFFS